MLRCKLQAIDMNDLRGVLAVTRLDRIRCDVVKTELSEESIKTRIEKQQRKWLSHLTRLCESRLEKWIRETRVKRGKIRGRPKETWNDEIVSILGSRGLTWT